jgi:hypothetical protein
VIPVSPTIFRRVLPPGGTFRRAQRYSASGELFYGTVRAVKLSDADVRSWAHSDINVSLGRVRSLLGARAKPSMQRAAVRRCNTPPTFGPLEEIT